MKKKEIVNKVTEILEEGYKKMHNEGDHPEGASYKVNLEDISNMSDEINKMIDAGEDLPSWVQDKITIANHNMEAILGYLKTQDMKSLHENWETPMRIKEGVDVSDELQYHIDNNLTLGQSEFRYGSDKYFDLVNEVKGLYENDLIYLNENDEFIISEDSAEKVKINGESVYLDCIYEEVEPLNEGRDAVCATCGEHGYDEDLDGPCSNCGDDNWSNDYEGLGDEFGKIYEAEYQGKKVELGKPKRGGSKKFYVYVRNPKTKKVKKVSFGAKSGGGSLAVKLKDPKARKAFADRHNCDQKNDKTKAGYWACRLPRYAKSLGLSGGGRWW